MDPHNVPTTPPAPADAARVASHCHADFGGPCLAADCPIADLGPLKGHLRPCPGALGAQHPAERRA